MLTRDELLIARERWRKGQTLDAGQLIFNSIPIETRPQWAARVLRLVVDRTAVKSHAIEHAIRIANAPDKWGKAHDAFSTLRDATLELEDQRSLGIKQTLLLKHLLLAELVAKVTYNSTNPPDEFDEDSGWWIAPCLRDILDSLNDEQFSNAAWSVLVGEME